jgi:hypothetical protein
MKAKILAKLITSIFILISCKSEVSKNIEKVIEPHQILKGEYKSMGQNLYEDKKGNIYFRTIDRSALNENREVDARYSNELLYDTVINGVDTFLEFELKNVLDINSFKKINKTELTTLYKDKNHSYFLREMAYGGTLHCFK